jgi:hypothetical protein
MIYEINTSDIPAAFASGASLIIISGDGQLALVRSSTPIDCLASYDDNQLISVMSEAKWRQPCKDCEI